MKNARILGFPRTASSLTSATLFRLSKQKSMYLYLPYKMISDTSTGFNFPSSRFMMVRTNIYKACDIGIIPQTKGFL